MLSKLKSWINRKDKEGTPLFLEKRLIEENRRKSIERREEIK